MPKPVSPIGNRRVSSYDSHDIAENAKRQDEERRIREDNAFFEQTGINPKPYTPIDPLVPINGYTPEEVANDGDDYMDSGAYSEDAPTQLIDPSNNRRTLTNASGKARQAYFEREKIKEDREIKVKIEKNSKKFKNAIIGLQIK